MTDNLTTLRLFVRVARTGSFSKAGREVGMSQPSASRAISALEAEVGARLLTRSTRAVVLTDAGAEYLGRIEAVLANLDEANQAVSGTGEIGGRVRLAVPAGIAIREIIPHLPELIATHPRLSVDMVMEDRMQDLIRDGIDVAIRFGVLADSTATARTIGINNRLIAASPAYLARHGVPATPTDLALHQLIIGPAGTKLKGWSFEQDSRVLSVRAEGRVSASTNDGAVAAAVAGLGIVSTGTWGCRAELADGRLTRVLDDWNMGSVEVHAVYPSGAATRRVARMLVDFLVEKFREPSTMPGLHNK
jgi:DNA-binding transcriptional LysR family regulator